MNPAHEFFIYHDLAQRLVSFPCCLCLKKDEERVVITILKDLAGYRLQRWAITEAERSHALPPMEDSIETSLGYHIIPPGFEMLSFRFQAVYDDENTRYDPIPTEIHQEHCANLFGTGLQHHKVHSWVWDTFLISAGGMIGFGLSGLAFWAALAGCVSIVFGIAYLRAST